MAHTHRWNYFYVPGDGYRYCACGEAETVDPDGKTGPVPAKSEAFVRRKIEQLEKKAYAVPGSLNARVAALVEKRAALFGTPVGAGVGGGLGAALGLGAGWYAHRDDPDDERQRAMLRWGAVGGGVGAGLGSLPWGRLSVGAPEVVETTVRRKPAPLTPDDVPMPTHVEPVVGAKQHLAAYDREQAARRAAEEATKALAAKHDHYRQVANETFEVMAGPRTAPSPWIDAQEYLRERLGADFIVDHKHDVDGFLEKWAPERYAAIPLWARTRAKHASLPPQLTHALVGTPVGAALGAGIQYARNYDNPDPDARWRAVGKGAFGGGVLGALGGALHGQLQHEGVTHAANQASVAARDHAADVLEKRQQALDAVGAKPHADYRRGQLEVNTAGDYHVDAVRKMSDGEFEAFLRETGRRITPEDVRLRDLRAARARIGAGLDAAEAQVAQARAQGANAFGMTQEEFDAKMLDPNHVWEF